MCATDGGFEQWTKLEKSEEIYPKFYDMLLMRQNRQIAIRYNGQITSWKPTVNRQKIDTLGGRYPKFVENAAMNYKTYSISGLISAEEDFNRKFLNEFDGEYKEIIGDQNQSQMKWNSYYQDDIQRYDKEFNTKYLIRNDTYADGEFGYNPKMDNDIAIDGPNRYLVSENKNIIDTLMPTWDKYVDSLNEKIQLFEQHDLYPQDHWYWEREFRDQLVEWLNDGEPKLYRSMPEGNIAVMLTDINLTPNTQLGRRIYNFNATMYEVADGYNLEELNNLGIISIPQPDAIFIDGDGIEAGEEEIDPTTYKTGIGQGEISSSENLNDWINGTRENDINGIYNYGALWESITIKEKLNEYYSGKHSSAEVISGSIKLADVNIQFASSPIYFKMNSSNQLVPIDYSDEKDDNIIQSDKPIWLGYMIKLKQKKLDSYQNIFVNEKGYYHIPKQTEIDQITLPSFTIKDEDGNEKTIHQKCHFNYKYWYRVKAADDAQPHQTTKIKTIIGQYTDDMIPLGKDIISLIYQNHQKDVYGMSEGNKYLKSKIYLRSIKGLSLDLTPYTYLKYTHTGEIDPSVMIIGETGVFDNLQDWPVKSLTIYGRRLTEIEGNYPYHMQEWNYYKDTTIENETNPKVIVPTSMEWQDIEISTVPFSDNIPNIPVIIYINDTPIRKINENWRYINSKYQNPSVYGYLSTQQVKEESNLRFNTVYSFLKSVTIGEHGEEIIEYYYQIYYIDGQWYPVTFINENTILAAVPIYGMINYTGDLVKERHSYV